MAITIIVLSALALVAIISIVLVARDMRRLHRSGKSLTEQPVDAAGVSPAAMTGFGGNVTHI
jgi:hypothetical protein